jgi:hypothetical protein
MNTNAHSIEQLQQLLQGMVVNEETISLRPDSVSSADLNYFRI